jgi:FtsP/CotA-like multicopper oxidase with cupredoxin domain
MAHTPSKNRINRRDFLKIGGGLLAAAAGARLFPELRNSLLQPIEIASAQTNAPNLVFAGTDGWMYLPPTPAIAPYHPDTLAPAPFTTYIFGFRNVTGLNATQVNAQKMKAQHMAPLFWVDQHEATGQDFKIRLTNLGLQMRPDLTDAHTIHWHGFRDAIPYFDGEPHGSVAVPMGKDFTYVYRPHDPGTYMFHCHVEDVEHVHMGMAGLLFVRPVQNGNTSLYPSGKFAYNDGDGSTGYDREFAMFLSEVWAEAHWDDAHIQLPEWSDYRADFALLNGRVYPDTLAPNGDIDPFNPVTDANGDLIPPGGWGGGYDRLQYQPYSALVQCNAGERVLLRFANLGFLGASMTLEGIPMKIVGEDATPKRGRDGTDTSYQANSLSIYPGASYDAIFTAPPYQGPGPYDTYLLYDRDYRVSNNLAAGGFGGRMTEVRVFPAGTLGPQALPNT